MRPTFRILFLGTRNSERSILAEFLLRSMAGDQLENRPFDCRWFGYPQIAQIFTDSQKFICNTICGNVVFPRGF